MNIRNSMLLVLVLALLPGLNAAEPGQSKALHVESALAGPYHDLKLAMLDFADAMAAIQSEVPKVHSAGTAAELLRRWADANTCYNKKSSEFAHEHPDLMHAASKPADFQPYDQYLREVVQASATVPLTFAGFQQRYAKAKVMQDAVAYFHKSLEEP